MVNHLPIMQETQVQSLVSEDPLEKGMTTHSSILAWRTAMDRGAQEIVSVHEISQARTLEWVAMPSSRGSFQPRD